MVISLTLGTLSCNYQWPFLLRIQSSEPSHSSLTHLAWLIHYLVRLESIQIYCFEWLHLEALDDCVLLLDSLVTLGVCRHLYGLVQRGSLSGGRCLSLAPIVVIVRGFWAFPVGDHERHLYWIAHGLRILIMCLLCGTRLWVRHVMPISAWTSKWVNCHNGD